MDVALPTEFERFVKEQVDTGLYQTASDVVREALRMLAERQGLQELVEEFNDKITVAEADVAAGRMLDPDAVRARLRAQRAVLLGADSNVRISR